MENDPNNKAGQGESESNTLKSPDYEPSVSKKISEELPVRPLSVSEISEAGLVGIKAELEKMVFSIDGLSKKNSNISDATATAITELKMSSGRFEKSVSQISTGSRNALIVLSVIGFLGLGLFSALTIFLISELGKNRSSFGSFEGKINEILDFNSKLSTVFVEIELLSKKQESIHGAILDVEKNLATTLHKSGPDKNLQAIEKVMTVQSERLAKLEREIYQLRDASKKSDAVVLRKEIEQALLHHREVTEGARKKSAASAQEIKSLDTRPQYPRPEAPKAVYSP